MGYLTILWMIVNFVVLIFQCKPVEYSWDRGRADGGTCIRLNVYYALACGISMVMQIAVFLLPLPIVQRLQIARSKKWGLGLAFSVGVL